MSQILLVIGALLFLIVLWGMTYGQMLAGDRREVMASGDVLRDIFETVHDTLPYLIQSIQDSKTEVATPIVALRRQMYDVEGLEEKLSAYGRIEEWFEEICGTEKKSLREDSGFLESVQELKGWDDKLHTALKTYNARVRVYEERREKFPGKLVAALCKMRSLREL